MKIKALVLFVLFFAFGSQAQEDSVRTIRIVKSSAALYRGTDSEIRNWYFYIDEWGYAYLANLEIPEEETGAWFERRKNSDNIFKSNAYAENKALIFLVKKNEPDVVLSFRMLLENNALKIINPEDQSEYNFIKLNIQE